jgi:hypothetical protein
VIARAERAQGLKQTILQFNGGEVRLLGAKLAKKAHEEICSLFLKMGERINSSVIVEQRVLDPPLLSTSNSPQLASSKTIAGAIALVNWLLGSLRRPLVANPVR